MKHKTLGLALAALVVAATSWSAPALDARTIMKRVNDRDDGKDAYAKVEMFLTAAGGYSEKRSLIQAYKYFGGLRKTYTRFTEPASIDGTSFLSWQRGNDLDDDQFLYLPELGRDRRIVSSQKDGDFVNTDFTYEDMQERSVDKDNHTLVREEKIGTYDCWVIESAPKDPASSQYRRWVAWVPKDIYVPLRVEFYTKVVRQPTKVLTVSKLQKINGIWTVMSVEMKNLERKHATILRTLEVKYNRGVPDRMFTRPYLKTPK
jgi:hypothetical protein